MWLHQGARGGHTDKGGDAQTAQGSGSGRTPRGVGTRPGTTISKPHPAMQQGTPGLPPAPPAPQAGLIPDTTSLNPAFPLPETHAHPGLQALRGLSFGSPLTPTSSVKPPLPSSLSRSLLRAPKSLGPALHEHSSRSTLISSCLRFRCISLLDSFKDCV